MREFNKKVHNNKYIPMGLFGTLCEEQFSCFCVVVAGAVVAGDGGVAIVV